MSYTRPSANDVWLAGVDGCPAGWIVAFVRPAGGYARARIFRRFADILTASERPQVVVVDIPIGLPRWSELRGRAPERIVRALIEERGSSVFRVPSRAAVYAGVDPGIPDDAERFKKSREIARRTSVDSKAFSIQGFCLLGKIVQVDRFLRARKQLRNRVYEAHPEVAFWMLNRRFSLGHPKKNDLGIKMRRKILVSAGFSSTTVSAVVPHGAAIDDFLDALACAAVARRIHAGRARRFPAHPKRDPLGLRMAIWA